MSLTYVRNIRVCCAHHLHLGLFQCWHLAGENVGTVYTKLYFLFCILMFWAIEGLF